MPAKNVHLHLLHLGVANVWILQGVTCHHLFLKIVLHVDPRFRNIVQELKKTAMVVFPTLMHLEVVNVWIIHPVMLQLFSLKIVIDAGWSSMSIAVLKRIARYVFLILLLRVVANAWGAQPVM